MRCVYDGCCEFKPQSHNGVYCREHGCKRKQENSVRRLQRGVKLYDEDAWRLEEHRKEAKLARQIAKNKWIRENKSFAFFDIESSNLDANYGAIICACIKPLDGSTEVYTGRPDSSFLDALRDKLEEYDYVVTFYGTGFDLPFLTTRLVVNRKRAIKPLRHIDMYYVARWKLKLNSNRQQVVGETLLGKSNKTRILGDLWISAMLGDDTARDYIINHCVKDVEELERIFKRLTPFINFSGTALRNMGGS